MAGIDAITYNNALADALERDGVEKFAAAETDVIRDKIWEEGFARKIIPPKQVDRNDPHIQEALDSDTIYYLAHLETMSSAMSVSFRGNGNSRIWQSKKFPISFFKIETEHLVTDEMTIRSMPYKFTDEIESKYPIYLQVVEDRDFILHVEAACQVQQYWANNGFVKLSSTNLSNVVEAGVRKGELARAASSDDFVIYPPTRADFSYLAAMFPGSRGEQLLAQTYLMTVADYEKINTWQYQDVGGEGAWQITREGYTADKVLGRQIVKTLKTGILRPGNIYAFAPKEFGGLFLTFMDAKLYIDRRGDRYESWAAEVIGMGFGNLKFVKKLELYSGSVTPDSLGSYATGAGHNADSGYEAVLPLPEDQLIQENTQPAAAPAGYLPQIY